MTSQINGTEKKKKNLFEGLKKEAIVVESESSDDFDPVKLKAMIMSKKRVVEPSGKQNQFRKQVLKYQAVIDYAKNGRQVAYDEEDDKPLIYRTKKKVDTALIEEEEVKKFSRDLKRQQRALKLKNKTQLL